MKKPDPEPSGVDVAFAVALFIAIVCSLLALWFGFPQDIVAQAARYFDFHAWMPK